MYGALTGICKSIWSAASCAVRRSGYQMSLYQLGWKTPKEEEEGERREIKEGNKTKIDTK